MSAFAKSKLKGARDALARKDYQAASDAAVQVLEYEPENYHANVFFGLALLELGQIEKSEQAYRKAIDISPEQILGWQGISKFYERVENWDKCIDALRHLTQLFSNNNDAVKCAETVQKIVDIRRERGTRVQVMEALSMVLPGSSLYATLSTLPPPDPTNPTSTSTYAVQTAIHDSLPVLEEVTSIAEKLEEDSITKEVEKRRMRMDASGPEQIKKDVGKEVWSSSQLPPLYNEILNHPNASDDLRRSTEAKLLRHKQRYLYALPPSAPTKAAVASELESLANGAVVLGIPDELAWMLFIEGKDSDTIEGYDLACLREFMQLFPLLPLTILLKGWFSYMGIQISTEGQEDEPEASRLLSEDEDSLDVIMYAYSELPDAILPTRILAEVYLQESDYPNSVKVAESGLEIVHRAEVNGGRKLVQVRKAFNVILATSLVHLFPPKHHPRALGIIIEVLEQDPNNVPCLMNRGYILQGMGRWSEAGNLFARVVELIPEDLDIGLRAKEENAWCQIQAGNVDVGASALKTVVAQLEELEEREEDKARCSWRLGKCFWQIGDDKREEAYRLFIASLKYNSTFAPAFTSLGIYYSDFASPPDPTRASKCFQKAFELDAREADAARRLASGFAEEREWDLVEVVARRTIDGEGGLDAGFAPGDRGTAGRYLPTNSWAWKAVGVVELTRRNYPPAIQAFQIALRADPEDQLSWVRLGEAYSKAGRHVAAIKALGRAHELKADDWICSYFIAEVQRQMGQFQEAINSLESILVERPSEVGVLMSLGQTHLEFGLSELSTGFIARAEASFVSSIHIALEAIEQSPGFRGVAWKTVADAVFHLSGHSSFVDIDGVTVALFKVASLLTADNDERVSGILPRKLLPDGYPLKGLDALAVAVASYSYRITLTSSDSAAKASTWYDLGVGLYSWATKTLSPDSKEKAEKQGITCLTEALREDPGIDTYWNALGNINFALHPKTAQHAYIKALEIDSKNVVTWTNLGLLYLHHEDLELANEAFYRAQTLDPDYTMAWVGQGLVATANGHDNEAKALFEHAVGLTADVPEADLEYATRVFFGFSTDHQHGHPPTSDTILPAFFVLDRYSKQRPDDATALHLFGLVCERLGQIQLGADLITRAIAILEAVYEETEDSTVERQYTIANSNLARLRLSLDDYEGAIESFQSALGLLPEDNQDPSTLILRVQAQFGIGLANFRIGDLEGAMGLLEGAIESAGDNAYIRGQVTVLLAQTLWALGTEECRESAKAQLLECITADPENLAAINALAGMGILTDDDNLVDAALSEILSLPLERRHKLDPTRDVNYLLMQHHLGQGDAKQAFSIAQKSVFAEPLQPEPRRAVARLALQQGEHDTALAVLLSTSSPSSQTVEEDYLRAIAEVLRGDMGTAMKYAQKAVMLAPWEERGWKVLSYVQASA